MYACWTRLEFSLDHFNLKFCHFCFSPEFTDGIISSKLHNIDVAFKTRYLVIGFSLFFLNMFRTISYHIEIKKRSKLKDHQSTFVPYHLFQSQLWKCTNWLLQLLKYTSSSFQQGSIRIIQYYLWKNVRLVKCLRIKRRSRYQIRPISWDCIFSVSKVVDFGSEKVKVKGVYCTSAISVRCR